jgi:hypothetical protein
MLKIKLWPSLIFLALYNSTSSAGSCTMKLWQKFLGITAFTLILLGASGYWYVFVADAPQLDPPKTSAVGTGMTFKL